MLYISEKKRCMQNDNVYYLVFLRNGNSFAVCNSVWQFWRNRKLTHYSFYRRLANFQEEEVHNSPGSYTAEFSKIKVVAIADILGSSFYQKASCTRILNSTIGIGAFKSLQSASRTSYASVTSFPPMVYCGGFIGWLSIRYDDRSRYQISVYYSTKYLREWAMGKIAK